MADSTGLQDKARIQIDADLARLMESGGRLPVHPMVLLKLMELGKRPDASPAAYAEVISTSNSLLTKIMTTVNSSWFGVRHRVGKILQAVNLLGTANVRILSITHCVAAVHSRSKLDHALLDQYWQGGLLKAVAARYVAERMDPAVADEAFLIALLQDMALPLMHQAGPEFYESTLLHGPIASDALCAQEQRRFGADHARIASRLCESLGLPADFGPLLANHHSWAALREVCPSGALAESIYVGALFPHVVAHWHGPDAEAVARRFADLFGPGQEAVAQSLEDIQREYQRLSSTVRPASGKRLNLPELLSEATGEIADITTGLVGQIQAMMNSAVQMGQDLAGLDAAGSLRQEPAQEDPLTGTLTRRGLHLVGSAQLDLLRQTESSVTVVYVDVNGLIAVNDRFGYGKGDEALRCVSDGMRAAFGASAVVSRYSGDEFVAVIGGLTCEQARQAVQSLSATVRKNRPAGDKGPIPVELSIGALWRPQAPSGAAIDSLIQSADALAFESRRNGGGRIAFDPSHAEQPNRRG